MVIVAERCLKEEKNAKGIMNNVKIMLHIQITVVAELVFIVIPQTP